MLRDCPWPCLGLLPSRRARPAAFTLTMLHPSVSSIFKSPRSLTSSHTGSFGQEVRQASITFIASVARREPIEQVQNERVNDDVSHERFLPCIRSRNNSRMSRAVSEICSPPLLLLLLNSKLLEFPLRRRLETKKGNCPWAIY